MATIAVHADAQAGGFERGALLDMRLEVAGVTGWIDRQPWAARVAGLRQRFAHRRAAGAVARLIDVRFGEHPDERAAAHEVAEMPFLVAERRDIDAEAGAGRVLGEGPRRLQRVDDAERAVEPAGMVLRLDVGAGEHLAAGRAGKSQHVADAVDDRLEPGLSHALGQPLARRHVLGREGRPVHAGLVGADLAQRVEIAQQAVGIDGRHGYPRDGPGR